MMRERSKFILSNVLEEINILFYNLFFHQRKLARDIVYIFFHFYVVPFMKLIHHFYQKCIYFLLFKLTKVYLN